MAFDKKYSNFQVSPKGSSVNVRDLPTLSGKLLSVIAAPEVVGRTTGNFFPDSANSKLTWFQVALVKPVGGKTYGYLRSDVIALKAASNASSPMATTNAQQLINDMLAMDKKTYDKLLTVARALVILKNRGENITTEHRIFVNLIKQIYYRQNKLKTSGLVTITKTIDDKLAQITKGAGIGVLPYVVGAVVGAAAIAAAYYAFKPDYDASKVNFTVSESLEQTLKQKLTASEYNQLMNEGEKAVDDAYNRGKTDGKFSGAFSLMKPLALGILGYLAIDTLLAKNRKRQAA